MKLLLLALLSLAASPGFASHVYSSRIVSTDPHPQKLVPGLSFQADQSTILNQALFDQIFEFPKCEASISGRKSPSLQISVTDTLGMAIYIDGRIQKHIALGAAHFVPEYLSMSQKIAPHYVIKLFDQTLLHVSIHSGWFGAKSVRISKIEKREGTRVLIPILEASGHG